MDCQTAICNYLKEHHNGKGNAVYSRELERRFSLNGRTLRRIISTLRRDGKPICSGIHGYYYAETRDEVDATFSCFRTRVIRISNERLKVNISVRSEEPVSVSIRINLK